MKADDYCGAKNCKCRADEYDIGYWDHIRKTKENIPACDISVEEWNSMSPEQQDEYIIANDIKVKYSTDISDTLSRGFGYLDNWGFWEYNANMFRRRFSND